MKKKAFRKLKRLELVELIYQLRKDNLEWRKRCRELEKQLRKAEKMAMSGGSQASEERLDRIEQMLADIRRANRLEDILDQAQDEMFDKANDPDLFGETPAVQNGEESGAESGSAETESAETEPGEAETEAGEAEAVSAEPDAEAEEPDENNQE